MDFDNDDLALKDVIAEMTSNRKVWKEKICVIKKKTNIMMKHDMIRHNLLVRFFKKFMCIL